MLSARVQSNKQQQGFLTPKLGEVTNDQFSNRHNGKKSILPILGGGIKIFERYNSRDAILLG